jgi:DNA mismatch repair protein MutS
MDPGGRPMTALFHSILFARPARSPEPSEAPACFADLRLDQVVEQVTAGRDEYALAPLYWRPLDDRESIHYRQAVVSDLRRPVIADPVTSFAARMREVRKYLALAARLHYPLQSQRWQLEAASVYCDAVAALGDKLSELEPHSSGFAGLRAYMGNYVESQAFTSLTGETRELRRKLASVRYTIHLHGPRVKVDDYDQQPDFSAGVDETFERFRQGAVATRRFEFPEHPEMNHVEARILELVARLNPETFSELSNYCGRHAQFIDDTIARFDREVQFYLGYLEQIRALEARGLSFCLPQVRPGAKEVHAQASFDLALAFKLSESDQTAVDNDFRLEGPERVLVVTGPNQGGKTTFARMFGQLHYLASLGLPVPGAEAQLLLADGVFTTFEREEDIRNLRGKLEDELVRIRAILDAATGDSVLVMNETFGSTTLSDARRVGSEIVRRIVALDVLCVFVTFVDELASVSEATVSMMSTVLPDDPATRTYKVVRKPADGLAYAMALAERHRLTYDQIAERITR